jgi:methylmalonyl-CoA/ethylmalonyl-CoA epimerase
VRLHHVAYVTKNLERKAAELRRLFGLQPAGEPVVDTAQGVRILFVDLGSTQLELLEPLDTDSPVAYRAANAPGLFHLCFEVDDLDEALRCVAETEEATIVKAAQPAPAIKGRRVAFVVTRSNDLVEFVEQTPKGPCRGQTTTDKLV